MTSREVCVPWRGRELRAAYSEPDREGPHPGVVVIHEVWGLNDDVRRITRRFADAGYAAVAPDLYSPGLKPLCIARTVHALATERPTPVDQADAARAWLALQPGVDPHRIGAIGFCMGGGFALALGTRGAVKAVSVNYGPAPRTAEDLSGVCPVVGSYGAADRAFGKEGERLAGLLTTLGVTHDIKTYDGAAHSFLNDAGHPVLQRLTRPIMAFGYQPEAAEDAWQRIMAFFDEHIRRVEPL